MAESPLADQTGKAEVGQPHSAIGLDQHVPRLDIAVHDPLAVRRAQRAREGGANLDARGPVEALGREQLRQRRARDVLHDQGQGVVGFDHVVELDDRGMPETAQSLRLPQEALTPVAGHQMGVQELDRDGAADPRVPGPPDLALPADREPLLNLVAVGEWWATGAHRVTPGVASEARAVADSPDQRRGSSWCPDDCCTRC